MSKSASGTKVVIVILGLVFVIALGTLIVFKRISANKGKPLPVPAEATDSAPRSRRSVD